MAAACARAAPRTAPRRFATCAGSWLPISICAHVCAQLSSATVKPPSFWTQPLHCYVKIPGLQPTCCASHPHSARREGHMGGTNGSVCWVIGVRAHSSRVCALQRLCLA